MARQEDLLYDINEKVRSYEKNLELEDAFIKTSSSKLVKDLCDVFISYGFNDYRYENLIKDIVENHLFYEHNVDKNRYQNDNEESIRTIKRLAQIAIEEKMESMDINGSINTYRDDIDRNSNMVTTEDSMEKAYHAINSDLKRNLRVSNDNLWYDINKKIKSSKEKVTNEIRIYREQNSALLHSLEEIVRKSVVENNKYGQIFSQIDAIQSIEKQKNDERSMNYWQELSTILDNQFSELSNEILSLIFNNDINQNEVEDLKAKNLNSLVPGLKIRYDHLFDKLNNEMIPIFIKRAKALIANGTEVNFKGDKETNYNILNIWYNVDDVFCFYPYSCCDEADNNITNNIMDFISSKYFVMLNDLEYKQICAVANKILESIQKTLDNFKMHILDENMREIQQMSNNIVDNNKSIDEQNSNKTVSVTLASMFK